MKRVLSIFISLMICVCGYGQKHMTFQGIEINGKRKEFVDQLINKGYKYENMVGYYVFLSGTFTSKKAQIMVYANSSEDVIGVGVMLSHNDKWNSLVSEYDYYKGLYTRKYGLPVYVNEKEHNKNDNNYWQMKNLIEGKNEWKCYFETEEGKMILSVCGDKTRYGDNVGYIMIIYLDKSNLEENENKDIDDI